MKREEGERERGRDMDSQFNNGAKKEREEKFYRDNSIFLSINFCQRQTFFLAV